MAGRLLVEEVRTTDKGIAVTGRVVQQNCEPEIMAAFEAAMAAKVDFEKKYKPGLSSGNEPDILDTQSAFETEVQPLLDVYHRLVGQGRISVVLGCKDSALKPGDMYPHH